MSFYSEMAETAAAMIEEFGGPITLRRTAEAVYSTDTGVATAAETDIPAIGVLLDFGSGQTNARGTLIQGGDKRLLLSGTVPDLKDKVIANAQVYTILSIGDLAPAPGDAHVLYDLHLRT